MGDCFLVGSDKDEKAKHWLKILHYIEYLSYDLERRKVDVWADFFIVNASKKPARLRGLHRGNIGFQNGTKEWSSDKRWTELLLELGREEMGLIRKGDKILLCDFGCSPIVFDLLNGSLETWGPERPKNGSYVCFTGWKSPLVQPDECKLFRICGTIEGETYDKLLPKPGSGDPITIMGGMPLQAEVSRNLTSGYVEHYKKFQEYYLDNPAFYHVFFERIGGKSLQTLIVSPDIRKVYVNKAVRGGRFINWYWSDSDFNVCTQANGPLVEMVVEGN